MITAVGINCVSSVSHSGANFLGEKPTETQRRNLFNFAHLFLAFLKPWQAPIPTSRKVASYSQKN